MAKKAVQRPEPTDPKARKKKSERIDYPMQEDSKLTAWPEDWNKSKHKPLKRSHFECESIWYEHHAAELEEKAKEYRELAHAAKTGQPSDRAKVRKVQKLRSQLDELMSSMEETMGKDKIKQLMKEMEG